MGRLSLIHIFQTGKKTLIVLPEKDDTVYRSARNIAGVKTTLVSTLNVYDILNCDTILVLKEMCIRDRLRLYERALFHASAHNS